jgi:hypothetical protein
LDAKIIPSAIINVNTPNIAHPTMATITDHTN